MYEDQHYLDANGGLHFLSAQDQANAVLTGLALPDPSWTVATPEQIAAALAPTDAQKWAALQATAMEALNASDATILRCAENGIAVPREWAVYRKALRAIVSAQTGDDAAPFPTRPAYPSGT